MGLKIMQRGAGRVFSGIFRAHKLTSNRHGPKISESPAQCQMPEAGFWCKIKPFDSFIKERLF